jgi:hypothetical protein
MLVGCRAGELCLLLVFAAASAAPATWDVCDL